MNAKAPRSSTVGRPRLLTDAQIAAILEWHRNRKSLKQVARENNVTVNTIQRVIRTQGRYKQCSPELRTSNLRERTRVVESVKEAVEATRKRSLR